MALPDQLLLPRRKIVPGFVLCVAASLIIFSVLLLSNSLKGRVVVPLFRGFNSVSVNSSHVSRPSSFSTSHLPPPVSNTDNVTGTEEVHSNVDSLVAKAPEISVLGVVLEKTHLGNFTVKDKNGSVRAREEETVQQITHDAKNGSLLDSSEDGGDLKRTHLGNFPDAIKEGSLPGEEGIAVGNFSLSGKGGANAKRSTEGKCGKKSCDVSNTVKKNNSVGNLSYNGELRRSPGGREGRTYKNPNSIPCENCDIFDGGWVRDDSKPYYPAGSCPHIDRDFNCHRNGRPDVGFVKWKWQPNGCDIPR